tara:strand:- start:3241 stop:4113 length:873 start_codon:yes stop_codon:yes gene_type:complete
MDIKCKEGLEYLLTIADNSVDLVLTDPPYITSTESGMNTLHNRIQENKEKGIKFMKTEEEWNAVKGKYQDKDIDQETMKRNYMTYGDIYGKKYAVKTDYGQWDKNFSMNLLDQFVGEYYKKLRKGGSIIIFFDLWKITKLKEILERHNFKQLRFLEWVKTNPQPLNSTTNYLTNCREVAILAVKGSKPTFNSSYDNAIYTYPLQGGKNRFHPTQKSLRLIEDLITKHSNEGDLVLDTFLGSGTTAVACCHTNRKFKGCELSEEYCKQMVEKLGLHIEFASKDDKLLVDDQ